MNMLRHEHAPPSKPLQVYIDEAFWDIADWQEGVNAVMEQRSIRNTHLHAGEDVLYQLSKFAGREMRHPQGQEHLAVPCGSSLELTIHGADAQAKVDFVIALEDVINWGMSWRPYFPRKGAAALVTKTQWRGMKVHWRS